MIRRYSFPKFLLAPLAALAVAGCQSDSVPGPESGTDYFPLEVGRYRIYAVTDTTWFNYQRTPVSYQFRETITDQITDATGQPAFRVVRARRVLPTDTWRDDSVMVLTKVQNSLLLTRNNLRSVELVFPARKDRAWDMYAFSLVREEPDNTQREDNRRYEAVDEPFQVTSGGKNFTYPRTLTTNLVIDNNNGYGQNNEIYRSTYDQVYAKGIGPVYRARRRYIYCADQDVGTPSCGRSNSRIYKGQSRVEVLIEQGKL